MATYIQGLFDNPLPITPFTPDYAFLQNVLKYKEGQYEQGFAQVKNLYNSLLNSKASNPEDIEVQKAYIADAERKLQSLASVDLSVPQNVGLAKSVFKTFLNDDELMHDISVTRIAESQLAKGQAFLQSDDPKQRAMHSSLSDEYVSTVPINELKWAKRGDGSITKVRPRYYIPAVNLSEKFKDFLDVSKYKSFTETTNGAGYIFRTYGGEQVEKGIYNLMNGLLTGEERKFFDMWGEVTYNRGINDYVSRGMTVDQAKQELAEYFYNKDLNFKEDSLQSITDDLKIVNGKLDIYSKRSDLSEADAREILSLELTKKEYEITSGILKKQIGDLVDPAKKKEITDKYYNGKWGILSEQILETSMRSVAQGMGLLTRGNEIKADDAYFKTMEFDIKKFEAMTNRMKALAADNEDGTGGGSGKSGGGRKLTEAEQKLAVTNAPIGTGYETVPQPKEKLMTFWENFAKLYNIEFKTGTEIIDAVLSKKYNELGSTANMATIIDELLKKKADNTLSSSVVELDPNGKSTSVILKNAFDRFINLYGVDVEGKPNTSPWSKFLETRADKNAPPTWANVYDFLFKQAKEQYDATKSAMTLTDRIKINEIFDRKNRAGELLELFRTDQKEITRFVLDELGTVIDGNKYDISLLVKTDPNGFKRLVSKDELLAQRAEYMKNNTIVGYTTINTARPSWGPPVVSSTLPVYKFEKEISKLNDVISGHDKINETVEKLVGDTLGANQFTLDDKTLSTFGTYALGFRNDVTGEIGEQALSRLFADDMILVAKPEAGKQSTVDVVAIAGDDPSTDDIERLRSLLGEIKSSALTPQSGWNGTITYKQFTGDRGDNRKEYIIRFDGDKLNELVDKYSKSGTTISDGRKASMAAKIRDNGIQIRTDVEIPGGIEKYGIVERYYQSKGYYESDPATKDIFYYRIDMKPDKSGYVLHPDSYYKVKDPVTGELIQKNDLIDIEFPAGSSFTYGRNLINDYITYRIERSEKAYKQNQSNPSTKKITFADLQKQFEQMVK